MIKQAVPQASDKQLKDIFSTGSKFAEIIVVLFSSYSAMSGLKVSVTS
jgi:hypothetical protein